MKTLALLGTVAGIALLARRTYRRLRRDPAPR